MSAYEPERRGGSRSYCDEDYFFSSNNRDSKIQCRLKNISPTGACILTEHPIRVDETIVLHLCRDRDVPLDSKVVWKEGDEYGLLFLLDSIESFENISYIINNRY